jgi:hypothetical protein
MTASAPVARLFTVAEANRTLPLVRMIVRDIVELFPDVARRRERLADLQSKRRTKPSDDPYTDEVRQMEAELEVDEERLRSYAAELAEIGAELKDPLAGLIDFPALIDGREAYLCWKLDEPQIGFWHGLDSGFAGRQPLPEDDEDDTAILARGDHEQN